MGRVVCTHSHRNCFGIIFRPCVRYFAVAMSRSRITCHLFCLRSKCLVPKGSCVNCLSSCFACWSSYYASGFNSLDLIVTRIICASSNRCDLAVVSCPSVGYQSPVMSRGCNRSCLSCMAPGTLSGLFASCGTSGFCCLSPFTIIMTKCVNVTINIVIAATVAGMGRISLFRAGRIGYDGYIVMTKRFHRSCFSCMASGTLSGLFAGFGTSRFCCLSPITKIMTKCVNITINIAIVASATGMGRISLFCAGRIGYGGYVIMTESRNGPCLGRAANRASSRLFSSRNTGRCCCLCPITVRMLMHCTIILHKQVNSRCAGVRQAGSGYVVIRENAIADF